MKGKSKLLKRISAWALCLVVVIATMNMPVFTMEVKAAMFSDSNFDYTAYSGTEVKIEKYIGAGGDVTIPSSVYFSGDGKTYSVIGVLPDSFKGNTSITSVTLPDTMINIPSDAFRGCTGLTTVIAPKVTFVGSDAFSGCTSLTTVVAPELTEIRSYGFFGCTSLQTIDTSKVAYMGTSAFRNCSLLTSIDLSSLQGQDSAGANMGWLAANIFDGCTSLSRVTIPASITAVSNWAFEGCSTTVEFLSTTPPTVYNNSFGPNVTFKVPEGTKATYESAFSAAGVTIAGKITENKPDPGNGGGNGSGNSDDNSSSSSRVEVHTHTLEWVTVSEPTVNSKGTIELRCTSCGHVAETQYIGNDAVVYESYANKLEEQFRTVTAGNKVLLELGDWHSVPGYIMERIIESNVDVELTYRYKGKNYDIVIPAGKGIDLHIQWYGPLLMYSMYGK